MVIDCRNAGTKIRSRLKAKLKERGYKRCVLLTDSLRGVDAINILPSMKWFYSKLKPGSKIDLTAEQYLNKK